MAILRFDTNVDRIPDPTCARVEAAIKAVVDGLRPPDEAWHLTHHESREEVAWEIDFRLNERTETLRLEREDADVDNPEFPESLRSFVRDNWPKSS